MRTAARRPRRRGPRGKTALVCAGGGVTGALYEIGCLRALEELLDRSVLDFELYVGVSGGAFVASLLAAGVSPREMYEEVISPSARPFARGAAPLFRLGLGEFVRRSTRAPRLLADAALAFWRGDGRGLADLGLSLFELLPAGLLDNSGLQEYLAAALRRRGRRDTFAALDRELYVVAVDLDNGDAVAFGEKGRREVAVSRAVQASTALPGLFRPVRIEGRDYVDGGVKKTAHVNLAIRRGADLVVCINPIVPLRNDTRGGPFGHLSGKGVTYVLDQALRIMLHGRMESSLARYRATYPDVDILVIEPARDDVRMFSYNIMRYGARKILAEHGYRTVIESFRRDGAAHAKLLRRHGIGVRRNADAPDRPAPLPFRSPVARRLSGSLETLDARLRRRAGRR